MLGSLPVAVNAGFQVAFTRSVKDLFRLTLDAMMLSCVGLLLRLQVAGGKAVPSFGWTLGHVASVRGDQR